MASKIIVNLKMNFTLAEVRDYFKCLRSHNILKQNNLFFAVSNVYLQFLHSEFEEYNFIAQDVSKITENYGPYTGEVSAYMLKYLGVEAAIIGHSERRKLFGEKEEDIFLKANNCLNQGLSPIVCVGEAEEERASNQHLIYVRSQLEKLADLPFNHTVTIAYEPLWAIGAKKTPSISEILEMVTLIKEYFSNALKVEKEVEIVYGGSVSLENIMDILSVHGLSGVLVGGAALDPVCLVNMLQKLANNTGRP